MPSLTTATQRGAEKKLSEHAGRRCYDYPGVGYHNVPDESASIDLIREFCREHFPETLPPMGPGLTDKAARHLAFIAGATDNSSAIPPERHGLAENHRNWQLAYAVLKNEGTDILEVLSSNIFGDLPAWLTKPP